MHPLRTDLMGPTKSSNFCIAQERPLEMRDFGDYIERLHSDDLHELDLAFPLIKRDCHNQMRQTSPAK
jgi:hypothetical protein